MLVFSSFIFNQNFGFLILELVIGFFKVSLKTARFDSHRSTRQAVAASSVMACGLKSRRGCEKASNGSELGNRSIGGDSFFIKIQKGFRSFWLVLFAGSVFTRGD